MTTGHVPGGIRAGVDAVRPISHPSRHGHAAKVQNGVWQSYLDRAALRPPAWPTLLYEFGYRFWRN